MYTLFINITCVVEDLTKEVPSSLWRLMAGYLGLAVLAFLVVIVCLDTIGARCEPEKTGYEVSVIVWTGNCRVRSEFPRSNWKMVGTRYESPIRTGKETGYCEPEKTGNEVSVPALTEKPRLGGESINLNTNGCIQHKNNSGIIWRQPY